MNVAETWQALESAIETAQRTKEQVRTANDMAEIDRLTNARAAALAEVETCLLQLRERGTLREVRELLNRSVEAV